MAIPMGIGKEWTDGWEWELDGSNRDGSDGIGVVPSCFLFPVSCFLSPIYLSPAFFLNCVLFFAAASTAAAVTAAAVAVQIVCTPPPSFPLPAHTLVTV